MSQNEHPGINRVEEDIRSLGMKTVQADRTAVRLLANAAIDPEGATQSRSRADLLAANLFSSLPALAPRTHLQVLHDLRDAYNQETPFTRQLDHSMDQLRGAHPELPKAIGYTGPQPAVQPVPEPAVMRAQTAAPQRKTTFVAR